MEKFPINDLPVDNENLRALNRKIMDYIKERNQYYAIHPELEKSHFEKVEKPELRRLLLQFKRKVDLQLEQDRKVLTNQNLTLDRRSEIQLRARNNAPNGLEQVLNNDLTDSLSRSRKTMVEQIERVGQVSQVLVAGKDALKSTSLEYQEMDQSMDESAVLIKALEKQAQTDFRWIVAGVVIFTATVLYIFYQRVGYLFVQVYFFGKTWGTAAVGTMKNSKYLPKGVNRHGEL